jgi:hypothetical protein
MFGLIRLPIVCRHGRWGLPRLPFSVTEPTTATVALLAAVDAAAVLADVVAFVY